MTMRGWWMSLAALAATPAMAESPWQGSVGAGVLIAPEYLGSDDFRTRAWPSLELRYSDAFYFSPQQGLGWNALREGNWVVSPYLGYTFGRDNRGALAAFEEVDGGATLGLRVSYDEGPWRYSLSGESALTGDVNGSDWQAQATWRTPLDERTFMTLGPSVSYSSASWTRSMFGVSAQDSARSGVAAYTPGSGYWRYGLSGTLSYSLTPVWSLTALAGVTYLSGDAGDSPIVDDEGDALQPMLGAFISYRF